MDNSIKKMFSSISRNYDLMNSIMTFGFDMYWRRKSVKLAGVKKGDSVLDLGAGTGDFAFAFWEKTSPEGKVVAVDFCEEMLNILRDKIKKKKAEIEIINKDVMELNFSENTFDFVSMAFGLRNFSDPFKLIDNICLYLKPQGKIVILETGIPGYPFKIFYLIYTKFFIPLMGKIFAGNKSAYEYLINTASKFPYGNELAGKLLKNKNIYDIKIKKFFSGAVYLYICTVKK
ncbi:MAG: ubiquinone/menaquinone biosynthesis methyltransferase [Ignavibacteria bacterium]|nr:ubiquinone/menaquinone biosynthesis methyltransferase [Ignavibacteria bacterium]